MAGRHAAVLAEAHSDQVLFRPRPLVLLPALITAEGAAVAVLLGLAGSAEWQVARIVMMIPVTIAAAWFTRRAGRAGRGRSRWWPGSPARWRARASPARTWRRPAWTWRRCSRWPCW
jgi:hypothetical protein